MKKPLLTVLGILLTLPAFAEISTTNYDFKLDGLYYEFTSETTVKVTYKQIHYITQYDQTDIVIPAKVTYEGKEYSVTEIDEDTFQDSENIRTVTIPEGVRKIGRNAFGDCIRLNTIVIPESVDSIGSECFEGCYNLRNLTLPSSLKFLGTDVFNACESLKSITVPDGITTIKSGTFHNCRGLESVTIPKCVTKINDNAFLNCQALSAPLDLESVTSIGDEAFGNCYYLPSVSMPKIESIGDRAFYACQSLTNIVLPPSASDVAMNAFMFCTDLDKAAYPSTVNSGVNPFRLMITTSVRYNPKGAIIEDGWVFGPNKESILFAPCDIKGRYDVPASVKTIGARAFAVCKKLHEIYMPSVTTISEAAFFDCEHLRALILPPGITSVDETAFSECYATLKVAYPKSVDPELFPAYIPAYHDKFFIKYDPATAVIDGEWIYGPNKESIIYAPYYLKGEYVVPSNVKTIANEAFANCDSLTSVNLNQVEKVGKYGFAGSSALSSVTVTPSVTWCDECAFQNCKSLTRVDISDLSAWCQTRFSYGEANPLCNGGTLWLNGSAVGNRLVIPVGTTQVSNNAFNGYEPLETVVIPGSVSLIGNNAFNCSNLKNALFAYGSEPIELSKSAFPTAPAKLFWNRPFDGFNISLENLETLVIGNDVTEIPDGLFKGATALKTLRLGANVKSIGAEAFSGCTSLTRVVLPPSVETVGASAFAGNQSLMSVIMGANVKSLGESAFAGCPAGDVYITAPNPPAAADNTFDSYSGFLHLQSSEALAAYAAAPACWNKFSSRRVMEIPDDLTFDVETVEGDYGTAYQINASFGGKTVTLPWLFFRSSNPEIATVDENGLVSITAKKDSDSPVAKVAAEEPAGDSKTATITILSLYSEGPVAEFVVDADGDMSAITTVPAADTVAPAGEIDYNAPYEVYNLSGMRVADTLSNLPAGLYIVRQGSVVKKLHLN